MEVVRRVWWWGMLRVEVVGILVFFGGRGLGIVGGL